MKETDPNGLHPGEAGAKLDSGKIQAGLLSRFGLALMAVADLSTTGCKKYSAHGWAKVPDGFNRYTDAMYGHLFKEMFEHIDPDTLVRHEVAVAWNALARLQLLIEGDVYLKNQLLARKSTLGIQQDAIKKG